MSWCSFLHTYHTNHLYVRHELFSQFLISVRRTPCVRVSVSVCQRNEYIILCITVHWHLRFDFRSARMYILVYLYIFRLLRRLKSIVLRWFCSVGALAFVGLADGQQNALCTVGKHQNRPSNLNARFVGAEAQCCYLFFLMIVFVRGMRVWWPNWRCTHTHNTHMEIFERPNKHDNSCILIEDYSPFFRFILSSFFSRFVSFVLLFLSWIIKSGTLKALARSMENSDFFFSLRESRSFVIEFREKIGEMLCNRKMRLLATDERWI